MPYDGIELGVARQRPVSPLLEDGWPRLEMGFFLSPIRTKNYPLLQATDARVFTAFEVASATFLARVVESMIATHLPSDHCTFLSNKRENMTAPTARELCNVLTTIHTLSRICNVLTIIHTLSRI